MSFLNEIIRNTIQLQKNQSEKQSFNGSYDYPIYSNSLLTYEGSKNYQDLAQFNKVQQSNYNLNPGLYRGRVFKSFHSPESASNRLLYADFNKMRLGNNKRYKVDIKSILTSSHVDKYDRIRDALRDEMWSRSRIKTSKHNYYIPVYEPYQVNKTPNSDAIRNESIPNAKDILLPKLPMLKRQARNVSSEDNRPFVTNMNEKDIYEKREKEKNAFGNIGVNTEANHNHNSSYLKTPPPKQKEIDIHGPRDMKIKAAIKSFKQKDNY